MSKLHELLAVDSNQKGQAEKVRKELTATFEKKRHLFSEKVVTFKPKEDGAPAVTEEQSDLQTTVPKELQWLSTIVGNAIDTSLAVAKGNTSAAADVVLEDGTILLKNVPATALLELEKRVNEIHALVGSVPTLDPAKGFTPDPTRGGNIFRARDDNRTRTKKVVTPIVLYPATPEHPAQTQLINEDIVAGTIQSQEWSGLITPAEKATMLERAEVLRRAIKTARARANEQDVTVDRGVGNSLLSYVFGF